MIFAIQCYHSCTLYFVFAPITSCCSSSYHAQKTAYTPVKVDADTLLGMPRAEVFVCRPSGKALGKRATFYR